MCTKPLFLNTNFVETLALQLTCYNGSRYLPYLFASLAKQTDKDWHLYVLDNGSRPEEAIDIKRAVEACGLPHTFFRVEETLNFAGGHNFLMTKHDAELVQLLNDDAFLEPTYLATVRTYMHEYGACGAASGRIFRWDFDARNEANGGRTDVIDSFGLERKPSGKVLDRFRGKTLAEVNAGAGVEQVFGLSGCLPMYRRKAVIGTSPDGTLFDATFVSYKEDVETAYRLEKAGWTCVLVHNAVAYHRRSFSVGSHAEQSEQVQRQSYRNHLWIILMHWSLRRWMLQSWALKPFELAKAAYWLKTRPSVFFGAWRETRSEWKNLMRKRAFYQTLRYQPFHETRKPKYDIAVVTVSHDELNDVYLQSMKRAMESTALKVQLIVVDNDSKKYRANELVASVIQHDATVILRNGDFGFGRSSNRGADEADAEYIFFLNPDTNLCDEKIFDVLYRFMKERPKVGIIAPKILYFDGRLQETCRRFPKWYLPFVQRTSLKDSAFGKAYAASFQMQDYDHEHLRMVDWAQGSALFLSKALYDELGGFDHRFWMYFEDIDLCRRSWDLGRPVYYVPEVKIQHAHGKESAKEKNFIKNILTNKVARAHIASWLKYEWKWRG